MIFLLRHHYVLCIMTLMIQVTMMSVKTKWIHSDFAQQKVVKVNSRMIKWIRTRFAIKRVDSKWIRENGC